jgi:hypothetical protein
MAYFMAIWSILRPFGTLVAILVYFRVIVIFSRFFGMLHQEKSGNPVLNNCMRANAPPTLENLSRIVFKSFLLTSLRTWQLEKKCILLQTFG